MASGGRPASPFQFFSPAGPPVRYGRREPRGLALGAAVGGDLAAAELQVILILAECLGWRGLPDSVEVRHERIGDDVDDQAACLRDTLQRRELGRMGSPFLRGRDAGGGIEQLA